jgi:hypothetical protein
MQFWLELDCKPHCLAYFPYAYVFFYFVLVIIYMLLYNVHSLSELLGMCSLWPRPYAWRFVRCIYCTVRSVCVYSADSGGGLMASWDRLTKPVLTVNSIHFTPGKWFKSLSQFSRSLPDQASACSLSCHFSGCCEGGGLYVSSAVCECSCGPRHSSRYVLFHLIFLVHVLT